MIRTTIFRLAGSIVELLSGNGDGEQARGEMYEYLPMLLQMELLPFSGFGGQGCEHNILHTIWVETILM